jgi:hypothetical protein
MFSERVIYGWKGGARIPVVGADEMRRKKATQEPEHMLGQ